MADKNLNKLVLHHTYHQGIAWDVSKNNNHGTLNAIASGSGPFDNSFLYDKPDSYVEVKQSESLSNLRSIRVKARIYVTPPAFGTADRNRLNIVEADSSFALFVNRDRSVEGAIADSAGNWTGPRSSPGVVNYLGWRDIEFIYDGISCGKIFVDGALVAARYDMKGHVLSVGPLGICVGHRPASNDHSFTFRGYIGEIRIWKYDEKDVLKSLIDPCCAKNTDWDKILNDMEKRGLDEKKLFEMAYSMQNVIDKFTAKARRDSPDGTEAQEKMAGDFFMAVLNGNKLQLSAAFDKAQRWAKDWVDQKDTIKLIESTNKILKESPYTPEELIKLAEQTCFGNIVSVIADMSTQPNKEDRENKSRTKGGKT
ncbi:MAG: hypothetical protein HZA84_01165 [Thaumarchaeota archaeon]|nr:hypothetical protein [Nitrososphaerota archaeon]